jgi:hypothetical protein
LASKSCKIFKNVFKYFAKAFEFSVAKPLIDYHIEHYWAMAFH